MDNITKFLLKLSQKQRSIILEILEKILADTLDTLDVSSITWKENLYRVRKWKIRIIFEKTHIWNKIIDINFRGNIYKKY